MKIILDTSILAKLFFEEVDSAKAQTLLFGIEAGIHEAHIPSLAFYEILSLFTKEHRTTKKISRDLSTMSLLVENGYIQMHRMRESLLNNAAEIACIDTEGQGHISSYDATFHALALQQDATFITAGKKHYEKTVNRVGSVILLSEMKF